MTNFIPIFPLGMVVYPGEKVNLHIFEPRYKQLIEECAQESKTFGMPAILNQRVSETGTLVSVNEIVKTYDSGEMDITVEGKEVFRILEIIKSVPLKLYSGAIVHYPGNDTAPRHSVMQKILDNVHTLHQLLNITKAFAKEEKVLTSYDVAHHIGLTLQQEYEVLNLLTEAQRLEYIKRHLAKTIPVLRETNALVEKVKLNGHFKHMDSSEWQ